MVQQLSLVSSITRSQFKITELSLTSLTGMTPQELSIHTVILKPKFPFTPEQKGGKPNQIEQYRIRMTRVWDTLSPLNTTDEFNNDEQKFGDSISNSNSNINDFIWTMQISDIPAAGKSKVLTQNMYETTILETDDILGYVDELGYMVDTEYWTKGVRFYYNEVIIEIYRLYVKTGKSFNDLKKSEKQEEKDGKTHEVENQDNVTDLTNDNDIKMEDVDVQIENEETKPENSSSTTTTTAASESSPDIIRLLDKEGKYFIKVFVNVEKLNDLDNTARGTKQLENFKNEVIGLINLDIPDRVNMDSRLNSRLGAN